MKLNIGGGYKRIEGFYNVDNDPLTKPEYLCELGVDPLPIPDGCVTEVRAHHILEHIGDGFFKLMQELYRVCENGAIVDIAVPHHRSEMFYGDTSHVRPITVENLRQYSKKYNLFHIEQFNSSSGFGIKLGVDFEIVAYDFVPYDRWAARFKDMSPQDIEEASYNFNNVYMETLIKLMVIK